MVTDSQKTVDGYIAGLNPQQAEIVEALRAIVKEAVPESDEGIKWGQPVFEHGGPMCYIKAYKSHVNFGFWRGAHLADPDALLSGTGDKMRHIRLADVHEIRPVLFAQLVKDAAALNCRFGNPTKSCI